MVCKASVLDWLGGPSPLCIYIKCNGMQDLCGLLKGGPSVFYMYALYKI